MHTFDGNKIEDWYKNKLPIGFSSVAAIILLFMGLNEFTKDSGNLWLATLYLICMVSIINLLNKTMKEYDKKQTKI
jgi:hypothetical protein